MRTRRLTRRLAVEVACHSSVWRVGWTLRLRLRVRACSFAAVPVEQGSNAQTSLGQEKAKGPMKAPSCFLAERVGLIRRFAPHPSGALAGAHASVARRRRARIEPGGVKSITQSAKTKKGPRWGPFAVLAERVGFEPTMGYKPMPVFKTGAFNRSATSPNFFAAMWSPVFAVSLRGQSVIDVVPNSRRGGRTCNRATAHCAVGAWRIQQLGIDIGGYSSMSAQ